ncbi:MAG: glucose-6-phosphate dehydrogenase [Acholeplasmatales bacterium]|nr:MAG: glucose-6-phosphate dehydrogenase [Acholeplasmatales bacterium]
MKTALLIVFGATGNLMYKKLLPALSNLLAEGHLPSRTQIICVGRRELDTPTYIENAKKETSSHLDWEPLKGKLTYFRMDFETTSDYQRLKEAIADHDHDKETMVYLAVPPRLFPVIAEGLHTVNLLSKGQQETRIVFEKPFGEDLESARQINQALWTYFDESQLYRIDHYLGKDMIQNIMIVRFANQLFESSWHHEAIASITIMAKERESVLNRAGYYDGIGAMKDMLQSHLFQMASLILMEPPQANHADAIRDEKVRVMQRMTLDPASLCVGQYRDYRQAPHVPAQSETETFVYVKGYVDTPRWRNVPIHFVTGKHLDEKRSEIIIDFKTDTKRLFQTDHNKLHIKVAPEEGVSIQFNVKRPGLQETITPAVLDYCHSCQAVGNTPEAYEKLILDLYKRQSGLFARWDEIETAWQLIEPLRQANKPLIFYDTYEELKDIIINHAKERLDDL